MSDSLRPDGLHPARFLCPWDSPNKNTGVGCNFLLQGIFPTQGLNLWLLCLLYWQVGSLTLVLPGKPFLRLNHIHLGTSLVVQWLRLWVPSARGLGSVPGQRPRFHMPQLRKRLNAAAQRSCMPQRELSAEELVLLNCGAREDLRVPWTARRSKQSILKEISPEYSLKGLILKLKLQYFVHLMCRVNSLEKTLMLGKIEGRRKGDNRRQDG